MTSRPNQNLALSSLAVSFAALLIAGCSSVPLPNIDLMGESDFSAEASNLDQSFPSTDETPDIPDDVRSDREWDESAREMLALQDGFDVPQMAPSLTEDEFNRQFEQAQAEAEAYKEDDPQ